MKKLLLFLMTFCICFSISSVCYAGDVPECLLSDDAAQVYFGEVKSIDGESITISQYKNVKGEFIQNQEYTYPSFILFDGTPKAGSRYLCGYVNEINPIYMWKVTNNEPNNLKIEASDSMSERMEKYLNTGEFEKMEAERLARLSQADTSDVSSEPGSETDAQVIAEPGIEDDTQVIAEPEVSSDDTSISPEKKKANRSFTILFSGLIGFIVLCIAALIYEKKK